MCALASLEIDRNWNVVAVVMAINSRLDCEGNRRWPRLLCKRAVNDGRCLTSKRLFQELTCGSVQAKHVKMADLPTLPSQTESM